jgi:hypothetical protein
MLMLVGVVGAAASFARADDAPPVLKHEPVVVTLQPPEEPTPAPVETAPVPRATLSSSAGPIEFGKTGSVWIGLGAGAASNGEAVDTNLYGRVEYFLAQDIEVFGELGVWNFDQAGKDATGFNTSVVLRYHFYHNHVTRWTMFIDGGIGLLFSTDPVNRSGSDEGSSFNFTPRVGGGFTKAIGDEGARLEVGLRWAHVSNARIAGNNDNPGRDSLMLYAGLIFPF